jgi:RNA polymerase-binding transcription factor
LKQQYREFKKKAHYKLEQLMDKKTKDAIKKKIYSEIEKTEGVIVEYKEQSKPISPENAIGRVSRMDAINNKSIG